MNNNQVTEKAIRDVFNTTSYITIGTAEAPLEYGKKQLERPCYKGKQFLTSPGKKGRTTDVFFEKKHAWLSDGDGFEDRLMYHTTQQEKKKGFLTSDFRRRDEFSKTVRVEQYREQLKVEEKFARKELAIHGTNESLEAALANARPFTTPGRFEGPSHLYDIGKSANTEHCMKCHRETFYCPHRAAHGMHNIELEKRDGGYRTSYTEIGKTAKKYNYAKPQYARKPVVRETFYRSTNIFFPKKVATGFSGH